MGYTLRRYEPDQGEKLAEFVLPIATRTYANWVDPAAAGVWAQSEHGARAWNSRLDDESTHVLVCERADASIAACAYVRINFGTAFFGGLYVGEISRGLGTLLRDERLRISRDAGASTAVMLIRGTNTPARRLAEKAGFEFVAEEPCSRLSTVPRLLYAKPLAVPALLPA